MSTAAVQTWPLHDHLPHRLHGQDLLLLALLRNDVPRGLNFQASTYRLVILHKMDTGYTRAMICELEEANGRDMNPVM